MSNYIRYAAERAIKTVAQAALAVITASQVTGIVDVDWVGVVSVSLLAGVLSLLTSVANYKSPDGK